MNNLDEYERGYIEAMTNYAVWNDGVQYVGVMRVPLNKAIEDFLASHKEEKANLQDKQRRDYARANIAGLQRMIDSTDSDFMKTQLQNKIEDFKDELR